LSSLSAKLVFELGKRIGGKKMASPTNVMRNNNGSEPKVAPVDMKLEVIVIPVSDVDRAEEFYRRLGWRQDVTPPGSGVFQFTPHGSACSIQFGKNLSSAAPGSAQRTYLIVSDIEVARDAIIAAGVEVSEIFHFGPSGPVSGPDPEHGTYRSLATFSDPDGNSWLLQEITTRLPGRIDTGVTSFGSASDLASAMRRAEAAHGEHEKRTGQRDANWSDWYAEYMAAEQAGTDPPQ
jgi:catechol 2,3-dioxygenase-like lactoylglutathione lyase family enzyme